MNLLRHLQYQMIYLLMLYAVVAIIFEQVANTQLNLLAALCIVLSVFITQKRMIVYITIFLIILHLALALSPNFNLFNLSPEFWLNQSLLLLIAFVANRLNNQQNHTPSDELGYSYNTLFQQNNDAVFLLNLEGKHLATNQRAVEMLGYNSVAELKNASYRDLVDPDSIPAADNVLERMLAGDNLPPYERTFIKKDGTKLAMELNVQLVRDSAGTPAYIQSIARDISKRKHAEAKLIQSNTTINEFQDYLTRLHHLTIECGALKSLDDIYRRAVHAAIDEFGFSRAALFIADYDANLLRGTYGTSPEGEVRPEHGYTERLQPSEWFDKVLEDKNRVTLWENTELLEYGVILASGWKAAAALWSGNDVLGYIVVDNHLTGEAPRPYELDLLSLFSTQFGNLIARRRAMLMLQESQKLLSSTLASLNDAVFVLDEETGFIRDCNDAALRMFGYSREEFIGVFPTFVDLHQKDADFTGFQILANLFANNFRFDYFELKRKDGTKLYADIQIRPMQTDDSQVADSWVMVVYDMSERKAMEQKLINLALEKDRAIALQQLITNLTHDIATPLSTIKTSLYIIGKLQDETRRAEKRSLITKQIDIIQATLKSVTEMSRIDVLKPEDLRISYIQLDELLTHIYEATCEQSQSKQQALNLHLPPKPIAFNGDESKLYAAVEQLLINAIQYTPSNSTIDLRLRQTDQWIVIEVQDTGIGISEDDKHHIFERLYRGQDHRPIDGSLGIGLPIAQRIIELHSGHIEVDSIIGEGSTFFIYLPLAS